MAAQKRHVFQRRALVVSALPKATFISCQQYVSWLIIFCQSRSPCWSFARQESVAKNGHEAEAHASNESF